MATHILHSARNAVRAAGIATRRRPTRAGLVAGWSHRSLSLPKRVTRPCSLPPLRSGGGLGRGRISCLSHAYVILNRYVDQTASLTLADLCHSFLVYHYPTKVLITAPRRR